MNRYALPWALVGAMGGFVGCGSDTTIRQVVVEAGGSGPAKDATGGAPSNAGAPSTGGRPGSGGGAGVPGEAGADAAGGVRTGGTAPGGAGADTRGGAGAVAGGTGGASLAGGSAGTAPTGGAGGVANGGAGGTGRETGGAAPGGAAGAGGAGVEFPDRTIAGLRDLGLGVPARLNNVCVIGVSGSRIYVQDPNHSPTSDQSGGLEVYAGLPFDVGDLVSMTGSTREYENNLQFFAYHSVFLEEAAATPCRTENLVTVVDPDAIAPGGAEELRYRYMLVRILDVTLERTGGVYAVQGSDLDVSGYFTGLITAGSYASVTGMVNVFVGTNQLAPRSPSDLVP